MLHRPWKGIDALLPLLANSIDQSRSAGLHLSDLYTKLYPVKPRTTNRITDDELETYAVGGFALEKVLETGFKQLVADRCVYAGMKVERPKEMISREGVRCSPDLFFHYDDGEIVIADMKAKWSSTKGLPIREEGEDEFPEKYRKNFSQLMGYLHVLSELKGRLYTRGRLICYYVCGNWKDFKPRLYGWDLDWSVQEIEENWDALMTIAREVEE